MEWDISGLPLATKKKEKWDTDGLPLAGDEKWDISGLLPAKTAVSNITAIQDRLLERPEPTVEPERPSTLRLWGRELKEQYLPEMTIEERLKAGVGGMLPLPAARMLPPEYQTPLQRGAIGAERMYGQAVLAPLAEAQKPPEEREFIPAMKRALTGKSDVTGYDIAENIEKAVEGITKGTGIESLVEASKKAAPKFMQEFRKRMIGAGYEYVASPWFWLLLHGAGREMAERGFSETLGNKVVNTARAKGMKLTETDAGNLKGLLKDVSKGQSLPKVVRNYIKAKKLPQLEKIIGETKVSPAKLGEITKEIVPVTKAVAPKVAPKIIPKVTPKPELPAKPVPEVAKEIPLVKKPADQKDYEKTLSDLEKWTTKLPKKLKDKAILFGSVGDEKLYEKSYLARKTGKKATDIDIYVPNYDAFYDVETGIRELDKGEAEKYGLKLIKQTGESDYVANDDYSLGMSQLLPTKEFITKVKETIGNKIVDLFVNIEGTLHQYHYNHDLKQPVFSPVGFFDKGTYDEKFAEQIRNVAMKSGKPLLTFKPKLAKKPPVSPAKPIPEAPKPVKPKPEVKVAQFDLQKPIKAPSGDIISAVKLDDGRIFYDKNAKIHGDVINSIEDKFGITADQVKEGGFITSEGKYIQGGVDAARIARQAKAKKAVELKRAKVEVKPEVKPKELLKPEVAEKVSTTEELTKDFKEAETEVLGERGEVIVPQEVSKGVLSSIKAGYHKVYDYLWTFGKVKRLDPALARQAEKSFHKATAAPEGAVSKLNKVMKGKELSQKEAVALTLTYEDKTLKPPAELKEEFDSFTKLFNVIDRALKAKGIMREGFPEGAIINLENELSTLRSRARLSEKNLQRQQEITAEVELLKKFRYLPHNVVVRRVIQAKLEKLEGKERADFLKRFTDLSYKFRMRKGRKLLAEYHKTGLLEDADLDIRKLSLTMLDSYYHRSAMKELADFAYKNGHIKPKSAGLEAEGWLPTSEIGVYAPEYRSKLVSPLLAEAYTELSKLKGLGMRSNPFTRMLGIIKTATFCKPSYLWLMDTFQKYIKGGYALNPIREGRNTGKAMYQVFAKGKLYHDYHKRGLYQEMYLPGARSKEDFFKIAVRATTKEIRDVYKIIERFTGVPLTKANASKYATFIPAAYRLIHQTTWTGDRIIRTNTALTFEAMGFSREEAVKLAADAHSAYSKLSPRYRKDAGLVAYVQSFRVLMPKELIENALIDPIATLIGKRPMNKPRVERISKSLAALIFLPLLAELYFKNEGFERDKVGWKWKKKIRAKGRDYELVIGINNIINMPAKWIHRLLTYDPLDETPRPIQGMKAFLKWEIQPFYRVMADVWNNDKSIGGKIYNREDSLFTQGMKSFGYAISQWFTIFRGAYDAMERAGMGEGEREKIQREVMKEALTLTDKIIVETFGYAYVRGAEKQRWEYYKSMIKREYSKRKNEILRAGYSREKRNESLKQLRVWREEAIKWVKKESGRS